MSAAVAVLNVFNYASDLAAATTLLHIAGSRVVENDCLLMVGAMMSMVLLVYARGPVPLLFSAGALALTFSGLIMTQSRGFWLAFLLGTLALVILVRTPERIKILVTGSIVSLLILGVGYILLGPFLNVILEGIFERFGTISTAFTQDISLINRFRETNTVLEKIYRESSDWLWTGGLFICFMILSIRQRIQIHSYTTAMLGLWYKYGLWGLGLVLHFWYSTMKLGLRAFRSDMTDYWTCLAGLAGTVPLIALTVSALTQNPFFLKNYLFVIAIAAGLSTGAGQRVSMSPEVLNSDTDKDR